MEFKHLTIALLSGIWFATYYLMRAALSNVNYLSLIDVCLFQHLFATVLLFVLIKMKRMPAWVLVSKHKFSIFIAAVLHVIGTFAINLTYKILPSRAQQVSLSFQPLITLLLLAIIHTKSKWDIMNASNFFSVFTVVLGTNVIPLNHSYTLSELLPAILSTVAFAMRNVLFQKKSSMPWDDPFQKFFTISALSLFLMIPVWLVKASHGFSTNLIFWLILGGLFHSVYSTASLNVLENISPVTHSILAAIIKLPFKYYNRAQAFEVMIIILLISICVYFFHKKTSNSFKLIIFLIGFLTLCIIPTQKATATKADLYSLRCNRTSAEDFHHASVVWVYEKPVDQSIITNINILAMNNPTLPICILCGTAQCLEVISDMKQPNVMTEFAVISEIVKGSPLEEWLANHPYHKLLAGRAFETHLQEVTILGVLWKYGGFHVSPMARIGNKIDFPRNSSFVTKTELRPDCEAPTFFDLAYFLKSDHFIQELARVYCVKYSNTANFTFNETVWNYVKANCSNKTFTCPIVVENYNISHTLLSDIPQANNFVIPPFVNSSYKQTLERFVALHYFPFVDTYLDSNSLDSKSNVVAFFDDYWLGVLDMSEKNFSISPIMLSVDSRRNWKKNNFFHKRSLVGCEDTHTLKIMANRSIDAFLSGPIILSLNHDHRNTKSSGKIYLTNLSDKIFKLLPRDIQEISTLSKSQNELDNLYHQKRDYESAKLVITQNINHALLCAAIGTPVIFINDTSSREFEEFSPLFHTLDLQAMTVEEARLWLSNFTWQNVPQNPNLGKLMTLKATMWDSIRRNQALYDASRKFGAVPMPSLLLRYPEDYLFHLIFTTSDKDKISLFSAKKIRQSGSFNWRHMRTVESIFHHHPTSQIIVHSNTLSQSVFDVFTEVGYSITVKKYDLKALLKGSPAENFTQRLDKVKGGKYWYSHETDLIRLLVLYKWGGVYMDTDMILVRPLKSLQMNTLAFESRSNHMVNGALLMFEKNNSFLHACLLEFSKNYWGKAWGTNGPKLLTRVLTRLRLKNNDTNLHVLSYKYFYMMSYNQIRTQCFFETSGNAFDVNMQILKNEAYAVHLNSKITGNIGLEFRLKKGTICEILLNSYCVLCDRLY